MTTTKDLWIGMPGCVARIRRGRLRRGTSGSGDVVIVIVTYDEDMTR